MFSGKEYHLFWHCGNFKNILKYSALAPTPPPYIIALCLFVLSLQCPLERSLCHIRCSTLQPTKRANCMTYPSGKGPICQTRPSAKMHMCLSKALGCPSQIIPIIQSLLKNPTKTCAAPPQRFLIELEIHQYEKSINAAAHTKNAVIISNTSGERFVRRSRVFNLLDHLRRTT